MDAQLGNYEIVLLDISLPLYKKLNLSSGEDLGLWIRKEYPDTKLFVLTSYSDPLRLNSIIHSISPEGFFIKSEATSIDIVSAIKNIRNNKIALGPTVSKLVLKKSYTYSRLDDISLQILKEISNGTKTVNLPQYIPLSKSGIEKRKRLLKLFFKVKTGNDRELIMNAKKSGYL
jgi:DNA-binding NarL/FixJ family response regulator